MLSRVPITYSVDKLRTGLLSLSININSKLSVIADIFSDFDTYNKLIKLHRDLYPAIHIGFSERILLKKK